MSILETLLTGMLRLPLLGAGVERSLCGLRRAATGAMRRYARDRVRPREWSNAELRKFAPQFSGPVINVSGWRDEDKTGGHYRDYFPAASDYAVSNYSGERGICGGKGEVFLDLTGEVPAELVGRFEVAFNHTTLEHIYEIRKALANICALSRDTVILVTPWLQQVHFEEGAFGDFWRPTPMCLEKMLGEAGFEIVYQSANDNDWHVVYLFTVARRRGLPPRTDLPAGRHAERVGEVHFGYARG